MQIIAASQKIVLSVLSEKFKIKKLSSDAYIP